jgi:hypothetical protein
MCAGGVCGHQCAAVAENQFDCVLASINDTQCYNSRGEVALCYLPMHDESECLALNGTVQVSLLSINMMT